MAENIIVEKSLRIEEFQDKYKDIITDDIKNNLSKDGGAISAQKLEKMIQTFAAEGKLLTIGIIGRVKAGKSSLLNSIFFNGKDVLPRAATPMTAALTALTYGEQFCAKVEYFSKEDLDAIKKNHDAYQERWNEAALKVKMEIEERFKKRKKDISPQELEIKVKKQTKEIMESHKIDEALYDQYERMIKSGLDPQEMCLKGSEIISAQNLDELMSLMNNYVGSEGKAMPFTKSMEIQLSGDDYEALRAIRVVDTPGVNDPVRSREQRTEEYLSQCDVIFIVSPAGQFMTRDDTKLMDRLSSKEGVRELFIVISKFDNGVVQDSVVKDSGNNLQAAVKKLGQDLSQRVIEVLGSLKKNSRAVSDAQQFDQLINESAQRTLMLSGLCHSMSLSFDKRGQWDETASYAWKRFAEEYPIDFDESQKGKESLDLLANICGIKEKIEATRQQKDNIILQKQQDYMRQQSANIDEYITNLKAQLKKKGETIENSDLGALEKQRQELKERYSSCASKIDNAFNKCFEEFKRKASSVAEENAKNVCNKKVLDVGKNEDIKEETNYIESKLQVKKEGLWAWFSRLFDFGGYEERLIIEESKDPVPLIRPGAVQNIVKNTQKELLYQLEDSLINAKKEWEKTMRRQVTTEYEKSFSSDNEDNAELLRQALQNVISAFRIPEFDFSALPAFNISRSGEITGREAVDEFKKEIGQYFEELKNKYCKITEGVLISIENNIKEKKMSDLLFQNIEKQINELEKNIKNKEFILQRLKECRVELENIS